MVVLEILFIFKFDTMKRRGKLMLINHTVYDWIKTRQKNYKMVRWHFPDIIPANCAVEVVIEWDKEQTNHALKKDGIINYVLFGSRDRSFQIQASSRDEYDIQINFLNLMTKKFPLGSVVDLAWENSDRVRFRLWGKADEFDNEIDTLTEISC